MQDLLQEHRVHLGANTNTVKRRVKIDSKQDNVEFRTNLNFAILGYTMNCLLIIRHHNTYIDKIAKDLYRFGNVYLAINAIGGTSVLGIIVRLGMEEEKMLLKETSHRDLLAVIEKDGDDSVNIRYIIIRYYTLHFKLIQTDLKIIKYLLYDPRMKVMDITNTILASTRTVNRRIVATTENHLLNFGLVYTPSAMKGYNYFTIVAQADNSFFQDIIKKSTQIYHVTFSGIPF